ncbi:hypothetical protein PENSPDRAFT_587401 [Peniophora sp. CONT]|nr:hypothetical protein PENSPDRAFT_587401 [Peniophora sp. CONT]
MTSQQPSNSGSAAHNGDGTPPPSKRWMYFDKALHLAIARATHKWTAQDFKECFPLWSEDQPRGIEGVHSTLAGYTERFITDNCARILSACDAQGNIDRLDAVVSAARAFHKADPAAPPPPDAWRENLIPRTAVRARTIPALRAERDRMRAELAALEADNAKTIAEVEANQKRMADAQTKVKDTLDVLERVSDAWEGHDVEEWQRWAMESIERLPSGES